MSAAGSGTSRELETAFAEQGKDLVGDFNVIYEDSLLFVGRVLGSRPDAVQARALRMDYRGIELELTLDPAGTSPASAVQEVKVFVEYESPISDPADLVVAAFGLVFRARAESGEDGTTSAEESWAVISAQRTFFTSVLAVKDIHPHLRRITVGGTDLEKFEPLGPDTFFYVVLPPPGRHELTFDGPFSWEAAQKMPPDVRPVGAFYTVRAWRPDVRQIDILCVLHGDAGPASAWAARAVPGDPVALWGPREGWVPPAGTDWHLIVVDDTGLPATARILESLDSPAPILVFAEVDNEDERQQLPASPNVSVTWLYRRGAAPGTTTLLPDAVRQARLPSGTPFVWGAGESRAMTAVRKYFRRELGFPRSCVHLIAYWRHRAHSADAHED
jgi:NADPH-dependent ferric siderophore reductase